MTAGVVADDLTGVTDTGHEFAARGLRTLVSASGTSTGEAPGPVDVHVVDTDSRYVDPEEAATAVARVIDGRDHPFVYKKVDSTLGGNPVAEVDAALDAAGADLVLVASASPRNGRTTVEGYHLVDESRSSRRWAERWCDYGVVTPQACFGAVSHEGGRTGGPWRRQRGRSHQRRRPR